MHLYSNVCESICTYFALLFLHENTVNYIMYSKEQNRSQKDYKYSKNRSNIINWSYYDSYV